MAAEKTFEKEIELRRTIKWMTEVMVINPMNLSLFWQNITSCPNRD